MRPTIALLKKHLSFTYVWFSHVSYTERNVCSMEAAENMIGN